MMDDYIELGYTLLYSLLSRIFFLSVATNHYQVITEFLTCQPVNSAFTCIGQHMNERAKAQSFLSTAVSTLCT